MDKITSKDIEALREFLEELEKLHKEEPAEKVTQEEWNDFFAILEATGHFPEKYRGRIAEKEEIVYTETVNGKPTPTPEGKKKLLYYDVAFKDVNARYYELQRKYQKFIVKALQAHIANESKNLAEGQTLDVTEILASIIENQKAVLDVSGLPNASITDKRLQFALTPFKNENAYIMPFEWEQLKFGFDENGELIIETEPQKEAVQKAKKKNEIPAAGIDQALLRQLFAATMKAYLSNYGNEITVYLPSFAREMNIDVSGVSNPDKETKHNANDFFKKLKALEGLNGVWEGGSFYRVFMFVGYDTKENTLTFSSPWLFKLAKELLDKPAARKTDKNGAIIWEITGISHLMNASIVSAKSKPTVEIIATLLAGLQQYGTKPEAERHIGKKYKDKEIVEYSISYKTLIERIPLISEALKIQTDSNKTTLLQRYFCGSNYKKRQAEGKGYILEEYFKKYTIVYDYYKDFKIIFQPPTVKTLSEKIIIKHHGINGSFAQNNELTALIEEKKANGEV